MPVNKIGPFWLAQINEAIGKWVTPILPTQDQVLDTRIAFHACEEPVSVLKPNGRVKNETGIKWAVEVTQTLDDFAKMIIGGPLPKPKKQDCVLLIGDEIVPNGFFILYSALEQKAIRLKFSTEAEATAYKNHFKDIMSIDHYGIEKVTRSVAADPWFDGTFSQPEELGFRQAPASRKIE